MVKRVRRVKRVVRILLQIPHIFREKKHIINTGNNRKENRGMYYYPGTYGSSGALYFLLLAAIVFSMYASWRVRSVYNKYQNDRNARGITGAQAAGEILRRNGVYDVPIREISGASLTDYYDPKSNSISLSSDVYNGTSAVAVGVACHEAGHALQYANEYVPARVRMAIIPVTNIGSKLAFPLILGGILLSRLSPYLYQLVYVGIICFALSTLFQLVTLPTEFDASRRAMENIEAYGILQGEDAEKAGKVLRSAAMTYVAALAVSLLQLLRFISLYGGRRRN